MLLEINRVPSFYAVPSSHKRLICAIDERGRTRGWLCGIPEPNLWPNARDKHTEPFPAYELGRIISIEQDGRTIHGFVCDEIVFQSSTRGRVSNCLEKLEVPPEETLVFVLDGDATYMTYDVMDALARSNKRVIVYIIKKNADVR